MLFEFQNRPAESYDELSKKLNRGLIRIQKHSDTTILNVEDRLNDRIPGVNSRKEEYFYNVLLQNQITVSTVSDLQVNI